MLPDFKLETYFSDWEFTAEHHMCASDMESMTVAELMSLADDADREAWDALSLGYTETYGAPELRTAIAATYENCAAEDVLTFAGAEEGIFAAMQVLLGQDDHAIVITPNYQAAESVPAAICDVTGVALDCDRKRESEIWNVIRRLPVGPDCELISRGVFEMKPPATGKAERFLGDATTLFDDLLFDSFELS